MIAGEEKDVIGLLRRMHFIGPFVEEPYNGTSKPRPTVRALLAAGGGAALSVLSGGIAMNPLARQ
jgi:hypothetical protein